MFPLKITYVCIRDDLTLFSVIPNIRVHSDRTFRHRLLICICIFYQCIPPIWNLKNNVKITSIYNKSYKMFNLIQPNLTIFIFKTV